MTLDLPGDARPVSIAASAAVHSAPLPDSRGTTVTSSRSTVVPRARRLRPLALPLVVIGLAAGACTSVTPTPAPTTTPNPTTAPAASAPAAGMTFLPWAAAAAARWGADSPQGKALLQPDVPYLVAGTATGRPNGITFTPAIARRWWDAWFAHPVDLGNVRQALLPGNLVLSPDELTQAQTLMGIGNTLEKAPADYNPLGLPLVP